MDFSQFKPTKIIHPQRVIGKRFTDKYEHPRKPRTKKSDTYFKVNDDRVVVVRHFRKDYYIKNPLPIIDGCILYPTDINVLNKLYRYPFKYKGDIEHRSKIISGYWSRYDFKYEPNIKEIYGNEVELLY